MPYRRRFSAKMADFDDEVTVVDVYDLASDIGKECEIIIEKYGPDAVTALLPKVINALELLENLAVRNEKENQALQELTAKISQLENDKIEKAEYRQRFEKEIEAIEEQWRTESAELVTAVARLQDENKRLRRTINAPADGTSAPPSPAREHDQEVLSRLSSTAEKQRATLRNQESQLQEKQQLIDSLTNQVEKLRQVSRDLRRKHKSLQNQHLPDGTGRIISGYLLENLLPEQKPEMRLVCEERSELTAIVESQQRDITALQQDSAQNKKCPSCGAASPDGIEDDDQSSKPTFSVRELRAILHERNELKLKLSRAEEQLNALQIDQQHDSGSDTSPSASTAAVDDEAPVQGPLPAEPDDAPWKRSSGIRKLCEEESCRKEHCTAYARLIRKIQQEEASRQLSLSHQASLQSTGLVFASSLLSLISPWVGSSAARCPRSRAARPPLLPPRPPPLPRRHSIPSSLHTDTPTHTPTKQRRYSDNRNPISKLDLRQELQNLNLGTQEFDSWLGEKFDENDEFKNETYDDSFTRDIPLERSISLDRGIDIFSHFRRIGSEWSGSFHSVWTDGTEESEEGYGTLTERYRSFDDVPASPDTRSRRASTGGRVATSERNIALTVLKDSCKGIETSRGTMSPQIRILSRRYTVSETFDSITDSTNNKEIVKRERQVVKSRKKLKVVIPKLVGITKSCPVSPNIQRLRNFSFRSSAEDFISSYISDNDVDENMELSESFCKSISVDQDYGDIKKQRRSGLLAIKKEDSLRRGVLVKQEFQNCAKLGRRRGSLEYARATSAGLKDSGKLQKDVTISSNGDLRIGPKIIICHSDSTINGSVAKSKKHLTSNLVDISRNCDCRICTEGDKGSGYVQNAMSKFFVKVVSYRDYTRKLYWETNNWNENEMYNCFMHILKLLLGLWLRHLDHN